MKVASEGTFSVISFAVIDYFSTPFYPGSVRPQAVGRDSYKECSKCSLIYYYASRNCNRISKIEVLELQPHFQNRSASKVWSNEFSYESWQILLKYPDESPGV